jgi:uncharacterized membrane protein YhaH (DUF805 family)
MDRTLNETAAQETAVAPRPVASRPPELFSLSDRVGRLRYFTYMLVAMTCSGLALLPVYLIALLLPDALGRLVALSSYIIVKNVIVPMIFFIMSIRRLHDLNVNGWWSLLLLIGPYAALILVAVPGQRTENRFGPPPAENSRGLVVTSLALPAVLVTLYFLMVQINAGMKFPATPPVDGKPHQMLRNYDGN